MRSSPASVAAFDRALYDACARLRPPEKLDCAEWADKYGMLPPEGASMPGKYFISNAEYQREPLRCLSDRHFQTVALMWSSQVGKTQIGLFGCGYFSQHDPSPQLVVQPTEDMAKVVATDRIDTMIRDTPELRSIFSRGDTFHKPFPGGQISLAWANSPAQLASRPIRFLWTDEEGRYGPNIEGDAVDQGRKRLATFKGNRKHLRTSSPALRKTCRITRAFEQSDQRHFYLPCPQCRHMQTLRFEGLHWQPGKPDTVYYVCEECAYPIHDQEKYGMVRAGEWRAHNPGGGDGRTAGFHLNALYSTIGYDWPEIVAEYEKCQGIPDKLQVFTNTVLALPWDEQAEGADLNEMQRHAENYAAQAPEWVLLITTGADVQKDRIEATKWGWGLNDVAGVIEHRVFFGDTSVVGNDVWQQFTAWRREAVQHELGVTVPNARTFVDSGDGNRTQVVYEYCRRFEREHVYACKGSSQNGALLVSEAKRVGRWRTLLVMVGTSTAKDVLFGRFKITDRTRPGYIHFPRHADSGCGPEYFSHLTAEALEVTRTRAGEISRWVKQRPRNEALDCAVYAYAARIFSRAPLARLARQLADRAAQIPQEVKDAIRAEWQARATEADQLGVSAPRSPSSASSASSPASSSPSTASSPVKSKNRKKVIKRPGFGWIHSSILR